MALLLLLAVFVVVCLSREHAVGLEALIAVVAGAFVPLHYLLSSRQVYVQPLGDRPHVLALLNDRINEPCAQVVVDTGVRTSLLTGLTVNYLRLRCILVALGECLDRRVVNLV